MMSFLETLRSYWDSDNLISLALNKDIRNQIESETNFLNSYYPKIQLRSRVYVLLYSITEETLPKCKCGCGKVAALDNTYPEKGFRDFSGPECSRKSKTVSSEVLGKLDDYHWLYEQKINQQKSIEQIAKSLNISTIPVVKYLKKHNLYQLNDARKIDNDKLILLENYELMYDYYVTKNLTLREIAKLIKCGTSTVVKHLNLHGIEMKQSNCYERKNKKSSKEETDLFNYIKSLEIENVEQGNRKILNGKEIDIFIPKKKIAIEYNGIYSHLFRKNESTLSKIKDNNYHLDKTLESKKQGINLYHFYSSEWNYEKEKIQNFIKKILHLNKIVTITSESRIIKSELEKNLIELNLTVEDKSVLRVKIKINKKYLLIESYEVDSELTLKNGFKYILNYLNDNYKIPIYYKIDRRFGEGNLFTSYGFRIIREIEPKVLYTDNSYDKLYENKIPNKTNYEIYNCGYLLLRYKN